jgi:hypothetical protein
MSTVEYDESVEQLKEAFNSFLEFAEAGKEGRGSKTKALSARKMSMDISTKLKDFRALSIANDKNK